MRSICLLICMSLATFINASEWSQLLSKNLQQQLYYDTTQLNPVIINIINTEEVTPEIMHAEFMLSQDPIFQFNVVLILDKKIANHQSDINYLNRSMKYLNQYVHHANPWVRTEAIWSIGNHYKMDSGHYFLNLLNDPSDFVFYETIMAYYQIFGQNIPANTAQLERYQRIMGTIFNKNEFADKEIGDYRKTISATTAELPSQITQSPPVK